MTQTQTPLSGPYNAAVDLIGRNLAARPDKPAFIDSEGAYTYADVARRCDGAGGALLSLGLVPGDRIALCLLDGIDFVATFLGALKAGLTPIALNTLLGAEDYAYMLGDSGARALVASDAVLPQLRQGIAMAGWSGLIVVSGGVDEGHGHCLGRLSEHGRAVAPAPTRADDVAFWLYSSGSTGRPKGAPHRHASLMLTAELFGCGVFGLRESDVVYSAAKLFFAFGLGNALTFPMAVGATSVLHAGRPTSEAVGRLINEHRVSVFCAAPTLFASMLASPYAPARGGCDLRVCLSAGEALPAAIGRAWTERTGVEIVDGVGSTEMLHIFLSNRPGAVRYGVTGYPVPGYEVKLIDETGQPALPGEIGELYVRGPTMTTQYWSQPEKTAATFVDGWMKTGDKFLLHEDGAFSHCGRADDMLKVSGIWVSPAEVESALLRHESVLEAAVIGVTDEADLTKTKAFVVLKPGFAANEALALKLKDFTKAQLAAYKYPRLIEFVDELPKTASGKVRRHVLREREAARRPEGAPVT